MTFPHPQGVPRFVLPTDALTRAEAFFRERGELGAEGVVLFGGTGVEDGRVVLGRLLIPDQIAYVSPLGVCVDVPGEAVAAALSRLRPSGSPIYVKMHTHPSEAYHSDADDANPMMRFDGGVSVVVPDFCASPLTAIDAWAVYRFRAASRAWRRVAARHLFDVRQGVECVVEDLFGG